MKKFNNLKLKTQIAIGYLVPISLFLTLDVFAYRNNVQRAATQKEYDRVVLLGQTLNDIGLSSGNILRAVRGYGLDPTSKRLRTTKTTVEQEEKAYEEAISTLNTLIPEANQSEDIKALVKESKRVIDEVTESYTLMQTGQLAQGIAGVNEVVFRTTEDLRIKLEDQNEEAAKKLQTADHAAADFLTHLLIVGTILVTMSSVVLGWLITTLMTTKLQQAAYNLTSSSNELVATMDEQEQVASQQAAAMNETTTTMSELEASCQQAAEQAKAAVMAASYALESVTQGSQAVGQTQEGILTLERKVAAIAEQIIHLSAQAKQIGSISQLVSDLASQTNMLALNSAVEANRAGEHGKGFTIVATEIRKLADQSQQSAEKIKTLVVGIQKAVNSAVMATDEGSKTAKQGVQIAQTTDQAFVGVREAVDQVVLNNQQVSLNLKQQVDAIRQVMQAMDVINHGAKETAVGLIQTKEGSQRLNQTALILKEIV
ncbi:MAG: chemotaxis protein [Oscillatoriophycideae cyanobacterium NC_groundwater_1537_Pr4_S-0.65um_50_18]|nr:chemotaxis protein [Oscillatoriophycideae cyanobacterium NC_groundwater_1537_Pr4_S-0.65um_50_18]